MRKYLIPVVFETDYSSAHHSRLESNYVSGLNMRGCRSGLFWFEGFVHDSGTRVYMREERIKLVLSRLSLNSGHFQSPNSGIDAIFTLSLFRSAFLFDVCESALNSTCNNAYFDSMLSQCCFLQGADRWISHDTRYARNLSHRNNVLSLRKEEN